MQSLLLFSFFFVRNVPCSGFFFFFVPPFREVFFFLFPSCSSSSSGFRNVPFYGNFIASTLCGEHLIFIHFFRFWAVLFFRTYPFSEFPLGATLSGSAICLPQSWELAFVVLIRMYPVRIYIIFAPFFWRSFFFLFNFTSELGALFFKEIFLKRAIFRDFFGECGDGGYERIPSFFLLPFLCGILEGFWVFLFVGRGIVGRRVDIRVKKILKASITVGVVTTGCKENALLARGFKIVYVSSSSS